MQGVIGIYSKDDAARKALYTLYGVQHRGQESAGVSAAGDHSLRTWKGKGLVSNVFDERFKSFRHPDDYVYIGCASGENTNHLDISPVELESERFVLSMALDGYVPNKGSMLNEEILGNSILEKLVQTGSIMTALGDTMKAFQDSYFSMVIALLDKIEEKSELIAVRDRYGIRPLYIGSAKGELFIASESAPIDVLESMGQKIDEKRDVTPGSIIRMSEADRDRGFRP
jgi:amidophosphoribosyltransferase